MSSRVSSYKHSIVLNSTFIGFFGTLLILSCIGLGFGAYNYATYHSSTVSTDCNVTSCVTYEGVCDSYACFYKTWSYYLDVNGTIRNKTYTVTSRYDPGQCSFNETTEHPVIVCYYDSTNVNATLSLEQPYDTALEDATGLLIVGVIGIVGCGGIVIAATVALIRALRLYREAKEDLDNLRASL